MEKLISVRSHRGGRHRYHCVTVIVIIIIIVKSRPTNPRLYGLALRRVPSRPRSHTFLLHNVLLGRSRRNRLESSWFLTTFPTYRTPGFTSALPLNSHLLPSTLVSVSLWSSPMSWVLVLGSVLPICGYQGTPLSTPGPSASQLLDTSFSNDFCHMYIYST